MVCSGGPRCFCMCFGSPKNLGAPRGEDLTRSAGGGASERRGAPGFDQRLIEVSDLDNVNDRYENECVGD